MALLELRFMPDAVLRETAKPVAEVNDSVRALVQDMLETMYHENGIGLAAPQIGVSHRVIVMDVYAGRKDIEPKPIAMINPEIIAASDELSSYEEGCLSIPDINAEVIRPASVTVRYMDTDGKIQQLEATGLLATCVQHEIDHLDGKLFIDYLSPLKRSMVVRRYNKQRQAQTGTNKAS